MAFISNITNKSFEVSVTNINDLPKPINNIITLEDNLSYKFKGLVNIGINTIRCGISNTLFAVDKSNDGILYLGTGNAIEVINNSISFVNMLFVNASVSATTIYTEMTNLYSFQLRDCIINGVGKSLNINGGNIVVINANLFNVNLTDGMIINGNINKLAIDSNYFETDDQNIEININSGMFNAINISTNNFSIISGGTSILVDSSVSIVNGGGFIIGNTFSGDGDYINGIDIESLGWIIENNGKNILNTSSSITERKVRSEDELLLFLSQPNPTNFSYRIDAENFVLTQPIVVPSGGVNGGLTFFGNGNNFTRITTETPDIALFEGGGNLFLNDMIVSCPTSGSSVFNMTSNTGFEAVELINVNFQDCTSLGILTDFRQGLLINGFILNVDDGLVCDGTWSGGFRIDNSRFIFTNPTNGIMFSATSGCTFGSRLINNANSTIGSGNIGFYLTENNFINDSDLQFVEAQFNGGGTYVSGITQSSIKSLWRDNVGLDDTFQGVVYKNTADSITTIGSSGVYTELVITNSVIEDTWFISQSSTVFNAKYLSTFSINIRIEIVLALSSGNNNEIETEIRKYNSDGITFTSLDNFKVTASGGALGSRVEPITVPTFTRIEKDQSIRIFIRNNSGATDISTENGSKLIISKR